MLDQIGERGAVVGRVAGPDQRLDHRLVAERLDVGFAQAEVGEADDLALVHRDAAEDLGEIFAKADAGHQLLGRAEAALLVHAARVGGHLLDRLDVGGEPGESVGGVLLRLDLGGAELAVRADPLAHGGHGAFEQALGGELGLAGEIVERHGAFLLDSGWIAAAAQACVRGIAVAMRLFGRRSKENRRTRAGVRLACGGNGTADADRALCSRRGKVVRKAVSIMWSAAEKFVADDGWAIASYIGLTLLMSLFPFLIFVAAVAGFLGSAELAKEAAQAHLRRMARRRRPADRRGGGERSDRAARRAADARRGAVVLFRLERDRGAAGRAQPRLRSGRETTVVAAEAAVARCSCWSARWRCWRSLSWSCSGR